MIDVHTHKPPLKTDGIAIISADLRDGFKPEAGRLYSIGIHPWYADEELMQLVRKHAQEPEVVAIGETGIDKLKAASADQLNLQRDLFKEHIILSEELGKPLIIHCVKAWDELLSLHKKMKPEQKWIVHGFRGNEILAEQLLNAGIYLSFGETFNPKALKKAWDCGHLYAETDDSSCDISDIYQLIAKALGIAPEDINLKL